LHSAIQRVYLERYLDDPRKFKFETYEVDGTSNEVLDAISGNGDVVIEFFDEDKQPVWNNPITYIGGSFGGPTYTYFNSNTYSGGYAHTTLSNNVSFTCSSNNTSFAGPNKRDFLRSETSRFKKSKGNSRSEVTMDMLSMDSIETGRVEKGGSSDQSFKTVDKTFLPYTCSTSIWKILPMSQKVYDKQELKVYCTNCRKKRKKDSDKFCSSCGNKF
jgi:hypothetical protein